MTKNKFIMPLLLAILLSVVPFLSGCASSYSSVNSGDSIVPQKASTIYVGKTTSVIDVFVDAAKRAFPAGRINTKTEKNNRIITVFQRDALQGNVSVVIVLTPVQGKTKDKTVFGFAYSINSEGVGANASLTPGYAVGDFRQALKEGLENSPVQAMGVQTIKDKVALSTTPRGKPETPDFLEPTGHEQYYGSGSGFVIAGNTIITNYHVIKRARFVDVFLPGREPIRTWVQDINKDLDLAYLKPLNGELNNPLSFRPSYTVKAGEKVYAVGYPLQSKLGSKPSISSGIIASKEGGADAQEIFRFTASINPGNSGGPVVDKSGNVVGVVVSQLNKLAYAKFRDTIPEGTNFAIKSSLAISDRSLGKKSINTSVRKLETDAMFKKVKQSVALIKPIPKY